MEPNNTQHKSFLWHLDFEPFTWHTFYGEQCPPFVTEENKEAWRRYLTIVIKKHLKAEVMNTPEFKDIEIQIREEKLLRIKWDEQRKRSMEKQRYRAKMERPRRNVRRYAAISKRRLDNTPNHRGMKKKLMDLMPETPFEGESMAVTREPNNMEKSLL